MDCQELNDVPSTFIVETQKENGEKYILRVHVTGNKYKFAQIVQQVFRVKKTRGAPGRP